jgi:biopolymer transport protein ExbB
MNRFFGMCILLAMSATQLIAQDTAATPEAPSEADKLTTLWRIMMEDGGIVMYVLLAILAIGTFMAVFFLLTIRTNLLMPRRLYLEASELASHGDAQALAAICAANNSAGSRIIGSAARVLTENPDATYQGVRDAIEDEGGRQAAVLWQRIQYLSDISVVAPMIGLLGTVIGMIHAFIGLAADFGSQKPTALAAGVSQALVTTAGGLIVGILATIMYSYFRGRVTSVVTQIEERCNLILQRLVANTR